MAKVWVSIELPEGHEVQAVTIRDAKHVRSALILGPPRRIDEEAIERQFETAGKLNIRRPAEPKRELWEYRTETPENHVALNQLGAEGWEVIQVGHDGRAWFFKRRLS